MPHEMTIKNHALTDSEPMAVYFTERVRRDSRYKSACNASASGFDAALIVLLMVIGDQGLHLWQRLHHQIVATGAQPLDDLRQG